MTDTERQARYRAALAVGTPVIRTPVVQPTIAAVRAAGTTPSPCLWTCGPNMAAWLEALPANLHDSSLAESLQAICDLDLGELQAIELPRGFGRD
jgi:hypothetical protein